MMTGRPPPPSPIDAATYTQYGLPWFARDDDDHADIAASDKLAAVETIGEHDAIAGGVESSALEIADTQIRIAFDPNNGAWSYVGTDCKGIPRNMPTMNLGFQNGG